MNIKQLKRVQQLILACLALLIITAPLSAQLQLERELIGAIAAPVVVSNGSQQQLQVDASFGESMIGYQEGDIIITVGFHQTRTSEVGGPPPGIAVTEEVQADEAAAEISVNAYPNPTVERLTVDLGNYNEKFTQLRIVDISGRTVKSQLVTGQQSIKFTQLDQLPNANYFLQGIDTDGRSHKLATVMVITY